MNRFAIYACLLLSATAQATNPPQQTNQPARQASTRGASSQTSTGDRIFAANCSRCHQAPMSLSPRITGTVIMHMRTRARLSREDEKNLLKYLAP